MANVYLSLGSNLGYREKSINDAIKELSAIGKIEKISSIYETEPWGYKNQNKFLNCVLLFKTNLLPNELLKKILEIEKKLGRKRNIKKYGPRTIDIDILFYDSLIINTKKLTIPHPLLHKRKFVLQPLCEIAPNLIHITQGKTIKELLNI